MTVFNIKLKYEISISRRLPHSVDDTELGHFTLSCCFAEDGKLQKCTRIYDARAHAGDVLVAVVVVVCLSSQIPCSNGGFNRLFPSFLLRLFQNKSSCEIILLKIRFICALMFMRIKLHSTSKDLYEDLF